MANAEKYDSTGPGQKKRGRRVLDEETIALVVKIGNDNPNWGYQRIASYIKYLGHKISFMTIKRILTDHEMERYPDARHGIRAQQNNAHRLQGLEPCFSSFLFRQ
ncbi:MAG: helix-turn-helix domain-containing protein [Sphaerochaetaceae bacterium]